MTIDLIKRLIRGAILTPFHIKDWVSFYLIYIYRYIPYLKRYLEKTNRIRLRNGLVMNIRPLALDRFIINETWVHRDYDPDHQSIKAGNVVIDLGAHIGTFTLYAARLGAKVFAVEPSPDSFALLERNITTNHFTKNVTAINQAVDPNQQYLTLNLNEINPGMNTSFGRTQNQVRVKALSLRDLFSTYNIVHCDLLKCDIEGGEYENLYTLTDDLFQRIDRIYLEFHHLTDKPNHNPIALTKFLTTKGYTVRQYFTYLYATRQKMVQ